ncbi:MAG: HD-GYP domain-containing protein [Candidatus Brocadiales bacterium]
MVKISLCEFISGLSDALNLTYVGAGVDWGSMTHSSKVCYIAHKIAEQLHLDERARSVLYYAALLHDSGLSSTRELKDILHFEAIREFSHCKRGYELLKKSPHTEKFSGIVLHHHDKWTGPNESGISGNEIPICSRIVHVADRVDTLMRPREYVLHQRNEVVGIINEYSGTYFDPQVIDAFNQIACLGSFWLNLTARQTEELVHRYRPKEDIMLSYDELGDITEIFAEIVDSKSPFTLQHSRKVARVAVALAKRFKFSPSECEAMKIAGLLHSLGKLSVSDHVLNKPDKLTWDEYEIIKRHGYFTYVTLNKIKGLETVAQWASLHHERLDGAGYPFRMKAEDIPLGVRIVAVSNTLAALAVDRPNRKAHPIKRIREILNECVSEGALDGDVVGIVIENFDEFYKLLELKQPVSR